MRKIRFISVVVVLCAITLLASVCSASPVNSREFVIQAFQKMQSAENYHMTLDVVASISYQGQKMNMITTGDCDVQAKPMLAKNIMTIAMDMGSKNIEQNIVQYIEEVGGQFNVYSKMNNQWVKQSMPNYNPLNEYDNYFKGITNVTPISEDDNSAVFEVVVSGAYLKDNINNLMATTGMKMMQLTDDFLQDMGDLTYNVIVNKKNLTISKINIDLSRFIFAVGSKIAESPEVPADQQQIMKEMLNNMTVITNISFSQFNSGVDIRIPSEARNSSSHI